MTAHHRPSDDLLENAHSPASPTSNPGPNPAHSPWLLIFQMGKVGSQTIEATLRDADPAAEIFRTHGLSDSHQRRMEQWLRDPALAESTKDSVEHQLADAKMLRERISARQSLPAGSDDGEKPKVIVGVREPVGLLLSAIFENHAMFFRSWEEITVRRCRELMLQILDAGDRGPYGEILSYFRTWFDAEIRGVLGINVWSQPFEPTMGYSVHENALAKVLIYRFEEFDRIEKILGDFLNMSLPAVTTRNRGEDKEYALRYREVKVGLRLPGEYLDHMSDWDWVRHFYSRPAQHCFREVWCEAVA